MVEQNPRSFVQADSAELLAWIIRGRRKRSAYFSAELFVDPAWDILLDLFLAELQQRTVTVRELALSSPVPVNVVNRWLEKLERDCWLARKPGPPNSDRRAVGLSAKGTSAMRGWLRDWIESRTPDAGNQVGDLLERIERGRRES